MRCVDRECEFDRARFLSRGEPARCVSARHRSRVPVRLPTRVRSHPETGMVRHRRHGSVPSMRLRRMRQPAPHATGAPTPSTAPSTTCAAGTSPVHSLTSAIPPASPVGKTMRRSRNESGVRKQPHCFSHSGNCLGRRQPARPDRSSDGGLCYLTPPLRCPWCAPTNRTTLRRGRGHCRTDHRRQTPSDDAWAFAAANSQIRPGGARIGTVMSIPTH